jgi:hypothetical protein
LVFSRIAARSSAAISWLPAEQCVHVEVATEGKTIRRVLGFGMPRCGRLTTPDA